MYKDTITLFNRERRSQGDIWYPTILTGVNLNADKGSIVKVYGETSQDNAVLNVRYFNVNGEICVMTPDSMKAWKPSKEWQHAENKSESVTFTAGGAFDFFWRGEWTGGSVIYDENYGDMSFFDYMLANYDYVYAITSVGDFTVIPHFEITGR